MRAYTYEERLGRLQLPRLDERRNRGGMIVLYKYVEGKEKVDIHDYIPHRQSSTRHHNGKLYKETLKKIIKFRFPDRDINQGNNLPKEVV